ncbi:hypothetical protein IFM89_005298 [Coptis chinensis]|uniref:Uncharacterized protein n=1 Tax=Coptis chinensis TaxID=261450 RepID=A0A835ITE7_9MAGN|nr:hypothetical protein IFM89_005298 [Coptis chinensis]
MTEPHIGAHILLLYMQQKCIYLNNIVPGKKQRGQIGITLLGFWFEPMTNSPRDIAAAKEHLIFVAWMGTTKIAGLCQSKLQQSCHFYPSKSLDKYGRDYFRDMSAKSAFTDGLQLRLILKVGLDMKPRWNDCRMGTTKILWTTSK